MSAVANSDHDVVVIGGGPAGSTAATLIAAQGRRVLLLERDRFPRFHIGESLMPATYWTLEKLGALERLEQSGFLRKHSVQFYGEGGEAGRPFYFTDVDPHKSSVSWQVDRAGFDQLLLDNARDTGVEVLHEVNVREVRFEGDRAVGVAARHPDGSLREHACRVVVDASGQTALLSRKLKLKQIDPMLKHASFFTRFKGAKRDCGVDEGATIIFWTEGSKSWFWYIPLPGDIVSVGVVGPLDYLVQGRSGDPHSVFDEELDRCPALRERLVNSHQQADVRVLRDFSYISKRMAGNGWILVGDAFGFLDPIYSSGVFLALQSGEFAAEAVGEAFEHEDFSAARLNSRTERYVEGVESLRKLVYAYYDKDFHFGSFLKRFPDCHHALVHLLMGNVYRTPMGELFDSLKQMVRLPESIRLEELA